MSAPAQHFLTQRPCLAFRDRFGLTHCFDMPSQYTPARSVAQAAKLAKIGAVFLIACAFALLPLFAQPLYRRACNSAALPSFYYHAIQFTF